jgi:hypothetical protein
MMTTQIEKHSATSHQTSAHIVNRVLGTFRFSRETARAIGRDPKAFGEAMILAAFVAVAGAVAQSNNFGDLTFEFVQAYGVWFLSAFFVALFGPALFGTPTTTMPNINATLRLFGYAQAPLLIGYLGVVNELSGLVSIIAAVFMIATTAFAVRQLMRVSWSRALLLAVISRLVASIPVGVIGLILGIGGRILGSIF